MYFIIVRHVFLTKHNTTICWQDPRGVRVPVPMMIVMVPIYASICQDSGIQALKNNAPVLKHIVCGTPAKTSVFVHFE